MKYITATLVVLSFICTAPIAYADGHKKMEFTSQANVSLITRTQNEVARLANALRSHYTKNMATWPSSLKGVTNYNGDFATPFGSITGAIKGSKYRLTITLRTSDKTQLALLGDMAERNNGELVGSKLIFDVSADQTSVAMQSGLSRFKDPSGELNTMHTNLDVNNQNLSEINLIEAKTATIIELAGTSATITTANTTNMAASGVTKINKDTVTNLTATVANLDTAKLNHATVSTLNNKGRTNADSGMSVNGALVFSGNGKVYHRNRDLDNLLLRKNSTAVDTNRVRGLDSSSLARKDVGNTFTADQHFNAGLTASNLTASTLIMRNNQAINTSTLNAGTSQTNNVRYGNNYLTNVQSQSKINEQKIASLQRVNLSVIRVGHWVKGGSTGNRRLDHMDGICKKGDKAYTSKEECNYKGENCRIYNTYYTCL
ncbi:MULTISPECIES: hypothetical protein [Vibrio]|uniref:Uncharacterized protein n=1 Tax=Vibrio tasmaniensis TaxID=212663 RepID=A0A2N7NCY3_9VIBR|nr:hypothetical protein [Vibrio tasmaniensis]PMO89819.1 hypothetical protein BCT01_00625 [Vibrio tasmaniensis]PMP10008.1 hypothetical protein BCS92_02465 [Vibrio tasmaniensis]TKG32607.1 hypothetical protein FC057_12385 [Vibrio tasmaniensis]TKG41709.1 hypothetical protein FC063_07555 [Vibrio tasmaniensis]TKG52064.1 hypothetical protein FC070_09825 [Vibrio tasmaniensis]